MARQRKKTELITEFVKPAKDDHKNRIVDEDHLQEAQCAALKANIGKLREGVSAEVERQVRLFDMGDKTVAGQLYPEADRRLNLAPDLELIQKLLKDLARSCEFCPEKIIGVDGKEYLRPNPDQIDWTPEFLELIKKIPNPIMAFVPMAESLKPMTDSLKTDKFYIDNSWPLNSDQARIPERNQRRMEFIPEDPLKGRTKLQILGEKKGGGFDFGGYEIVVMDGSPKTSESTRNKSAIQLTEEFKQLGLELPTPEAVAIITAMMKSENKPFDDKGSGWQKGYIPQFSVVPFGRWLTNGRMLDFRRRSPDGFYGFLGGRRSARAKSRQF